MGRSRCRDPCAASCWGMPAAHGNDAPACGHDRPRPAPPVRAAAMRMRPGLPVRACSRSPAPETRCDLSCRCGCRRCSPPSPAPPRRRKPRRPPPPRRNGWPGAATSAGTRSGASRRRAPRRRSPGSCAPSACSRGPASPAPAWSPCSRTDGPASPSAPTWMRCRWPNRPACPMPPPPPAHYRGNAVGVMHACGHDMHMAILPGVALARRRAPCRAR